jgi:CheY-like chemotaxis protein
MARGPGPAADRPLRVLLVEDNPDDAEITRLVAERTVPCRVDVITDGVSAVQALRGEASAEHPPPDVILLDLRLPGASGLDVLRHVRRQPAYRRTPVIVLTTVGDVEETIVACYAAGANSFLQKPATSARFAEALRVLTLAAAGTAAQ